MPYLNIMTHIEGRKHDDLLHEKEGNAFPYLVWLDADGEILGKQDDQSVKGFTATLGLFERRAALQAKADAGDKTAKIDLLILECQLGLIEFDELDGDLEGVELNAEQRKVYRQLRANAIASDAFAMYRGAGGGKDAAADAAEEFHGLYKTGVHPEGPFARFYWEILRQRAEAQRDLPLMEDCVKNIKRLLKDNPRAASHIEKIEEALADMKAGPGGDGG